MNELFLSFVDFFENMGIWRFFYTICVLSVFADCVNTAISFLNNMANKVLELFRIINGKKQCFDKRDKENKDKEKENKDE